MQHRSPHLLALGRFRGSVSALLLAVSCALAQGPVGGAIELDAESLDIDRKNDRLLFTGVRITQGSLAISAASAQSSSLEFARSTWTFTGSVRIVDQETEIRAERAELRFEDQTLREARVHGAPVIFERRLGDGPRQLTRGQAREIVYDFQKDILSLKGDAWLAEGANEMTGNQIVYNLAEQRVLAGSPAENGDRVRITITPPTEGGNPVERERIQRDPPDTAPLP